MPDRWPSYSVRDLQVAGSLLVEDGNHGESRPRPNEFGPGGEAFIRAADMDDGRILFESASRISRAARDRIRKGIGAPGDVLLSHKGTVGKVALAPLDCEPFVCSPQTTFWRTLNASTLDRQYLLAYMRSHDFQRQLHARMGETDMAPYVSLTNQRGLLVPVPPIQDQRGIGRVLGALDNKIDLNRRMNRTLEAIAQALFRSWFIDFEPVHAIRDGRPLTGLGPDVQAQFPRTFAATTVPDGWRWGRIGDEVEVVGGSTPSTQNPEFWEHGEHAWATPKDLAGLADPVLLDTERRVTAAGLRTISSGLLPPGTVLLSSRAPIGYMAVTQVATAINQGFIAMKPSPQLTSWYLLHWARENMGTIVGRANGTTFLEVSKANFRPIPVLVPSRQCLAAFDDAVGPLYAMVVANLRQSQTLAELRDALLPRLLSGEVRVRDAERELEATT